MRSTWLVLALLSLSTASPLGSQAEQPLQRLHGHSASADAARRGSLSGVVRRGGDSAHRFLNDATKGELNRTRLISSLLVYSGPST